MKNQLLCDVMEGRLLSAEEERRGGWCGWSLDLLRYIHIDKRFHFFTQEIKNGLIFICKRH